MKMLSSPKALRASPRTSSKAGATSSSLLHRRIPRPPPPAAAFNMTGKPNSIAFASASAASFRGSAVPGMTGTPQPTAIFFASSLSPILARTRLGGPMNFMPASSQAFAKAAVLAQEAVARVYGVHAALFGEGDNLVYREIGPQRAQVLAYEIGLVRLRAEEVHRVLLRVYGDRAQVEVVARAEYAYGYLAAVRRHDLP